MRSAVAAAPWAPSGLEDAPPRVVRGPARLVRGWAGALAMTALAALFHTAAEPGHGFPEVGVVAFAAVLAAPLCTALAGRALSLWRTAAAVAIAQGLFHVLYGLAAGGHAVAPAAGVDPAHLGHARPGAGALLAPGEALSSAPTGHLTDLRMLAAHVIAAVLTVLVLRRGEALVLTIAERVVAAVCPPPTANGPLPAPARLRVPVPPVLRPATSLALLSSPGRRGPPFALAA